MSDPDATLPPWKARSLRALAWAREHPGVTIPALAFLAGVALGCWMTW